MLRLGAGLLLATVVVGDDTWELDGWQVYGEKNWGKGGFPESWWWGQAHGFDEPSVCVAFAGGQVLIAPLAQSLRVDALGGSLVNGEWDPRVAMTAGGVPIIGSGKKERMLGALKAAAIEMDRPSLA